MTTTTITTIICDGCGTKAGPYEHALRIAGWYKLSYGSANTHVGTHHPVWDICNECFTVLGKWMIDHTLRSREEDDPRIAVNRTTADGHCTQPEADQ